jgi:replicative DNA helicase
MVPIVANPNYDSNVDNLSKYGIEFQTKVLASIISAPEFLEQSFDVINPYFFDSDAGRWVAKKVLTYYNEYRTLPTLEYFKIEMTSETDDAIRAGVVELLRKVLTKVKDTDLNYVRDRFLDFARNQSLKSAIIKSVDLLQEGKYDSIKNIVDQALRSGQPKHVGHRWNEDVDIRLTHVCRDTVTTGWGVIDTITGGGLAGGELGVIAAPSGIGKSWALATIGANALRTGKNVAHYTLELNENYVGIRYDTIFTGIEPGKIPDNIDLVKDVVGNIPGKLIIRYYPAKSATCNSLSAHVQQLTALGHKPDILIVDYADLLRSSERVDARYQELGAIYEELRGIAGELNIPVWTASQTQRSSIQDDVIQADKIAESYQKIMTADLVISFSRKLEDKVNKTGRAHIIKNRFGPDGQTFPVIIDTSIGQIEVYDESSSKGILLKKQMNNQQSDEKSNLRKKLAEMTGLESLDD